MTRARRVALALSACALLSGLGWFAGSTALAHRTNGDRRSAAECRALRTPSMRQQCLACVSRRSGHHFHPAMPEGFRCRPNTGRP